MRCRAAAVACTLLVAAPAAGVAAEYVPPPIMPIPTAWQGRAAAVVRVLDKLDAHVETLTLRAGETGTYKSLAVTVRSCMDRPDGLPADSAAFLDIQDRHGDVQPFTGWTLAREPAIGVFESPIYGVQLASCDGEAVAPAAPPLPAPVPPPASLTPEEAGAAAAADTAGSGGSSTSVDGPQGPSVDVPEAGDGGPTPAAKPPAPPAQGAPADAPDGGGAQPDPVYPDGPPPPPASSQAPPP